MTEALDLKQTVNTSVANIERILIIIKTQVSVECKIVLIQFIKQHRSISL